MNYFVFDIDVCYSTLSDLPGPKSSYLLNDQQYPIHSKQQNWAQLRLEPTF